MTNNQYNILLSKLAKANEKYKKLLLEAEEEFKCRYGDNPSNLEYDGWIDTYHITTGFISAEEIEEEMTGVDEPSEEMKQKISPKE